MGIAGTCWYICLLWAMVAVLTSAASVVPTAELARDIMSVGFAAASLLFGLLVAVCQRRAWSAPTWAVRSLQTLAVLATLFVLFGVGQSARDPTES
jgi:peptidoglycan/LPS O-acetylase OafA/YrhL